MAISKPNYKIPLTGKWPVFLLGLFFMAQSFAADISHEIALETSLKKIFVEKHPECADGAVDLSLKKVQLKLAADPDANLSWKLFCLEFWQSMENPGQANSFEKRLWKESADNIGLNWVIGLTLLDRQRYELSSKYLQRSHKLMLKEGQLRSAQMAFSFFHRANGAIAQRQYQSALHYLEWADLFDPHSEANVLMRLKIHLLENPPWQWNPVKIWELVKTWQARLVLFQNKTSFTLFIFQWLRTAVGIFCFCLTLAFLFKQYPQVIHPYSERLSKKISIHKRYLILAVLLAFIPVAGFGIMGCVFICLLWIRPFLDVKDKKIANVCLILMMLAPSILWMESRMYLHRQNGSIQNLYQQVYENGWDKKLEKKVIDFEALSPYEKMMRYISWSVLKRKMGDYANAKILALRAAEINPENPHVLNNLGSIHFVFGEYDKAGSNFKKASYKLTKSPELYFNLSQVELYLNNSYKHALQLEKAMSYGKEHIGDYIEKNDRFISKRKFSEKGIQASWPLVRKTMDLPLQWNDVLNFSQPFAWEDFQYHFFNLEAPSLFYLLIVALALMLITLAKSFPSLSWTYELNFICKSCGAVICKHCRKGPYCSNCNSVLSGVVDEEVKKDLVLEIQKKERNKFNWISMLLDSTVLGVGQIYAKKSFWGYIQITIFSFCLALAISSRFFLSEYTSFLNTMFLTIAVFPLVLGYLVMWVKMAMSLKWHGVVK